MNAWFCWFKHRWLSKRIKRVCLRCSRREVLTLRGWVEHTYPLDGDPASDPTECIDECGDLSTLGFEYIWRGLEKKW